MDGARPLASPAARGYADWHRYGGKSGRQAISTIDHMLLYVSGKSFDAAIDDQTIAEIVAVSRSRNAPLNVTGALIATTGHFAQILEGPSMAIEELMDSIHRDSRHHDVTVLREMPILQRRFAGWSMAYSGPSTYVARHVAPLLESKLGAGKYGIERLIELMSGFAAA